MEDSDESSTDANSRTECPIQLEAKCDGQTQIGSWEWVGFDDLD